MFFHRPVSALLAAGVPFSDDGSKSGSDMEILGLWNPSGISGFCVLL
jgi:hypothetical protein